jgi:hypothetical protein
VNGDTVYYHSPENEIKPELFHYNMTNVTIARQRFGNTRSRVNEDSTKVSTDTDKQQFSMDMR